MRCESADLGQDKTGQDRTGKRTIVRTGAWGRCSTFYCTTVRVLAKTTRRSCAEFVFDEKRSCICRSYWLLRGSPNFVETMSCANGDDGPSVGDGCRGIT